MKANIRILLFFSLIALMGCEHVKNTFSEISGEMDTKESKKVVAAKKIRDVQPLGDGWFEAVGRADIVNITPEDAKRKAILNACENAIQYTGFEVSQRILDIQAESDHKIIQNDFLSLTSLTTKGVILEKELLDEKVTIEGKRLVQTVWMKIRLGTQQGRKDPYFQIHAALNKETFKVGDTLQVTITATQDCYITILNIADEKAYVLFPNQYFNDNFVRKGQKVSFPSWHHTKMGVTIPALLSPGKERELGIIKVLATKKEASLQGLCSQSPYGTSELVLQDLMNYFIQIPREEIEEADLTYKIYK